MAGRPDLTADQLRAVGTRLQKVFIEAGPGAGKTTVAAERFGVVRYCRTPRGTRGVVAASFTISASNELRQRILSRWGPSALDGNSRVRTIDAELLAILTFLLRTGRVTWPGGRTDVTPRDSWAGHPRRTYRPKQWRGYVPQLVGAEVRSVRGALWSRTGFNKGDLDVLLKEGHCLHEEVREVVATALRDPELRAAVVEHRRQTVSHFIVDEIFDADLLDVELIAIHCEANVPVTLVGDRWQALYEFRNAQPAQVQQALTSLGFVRFEVLQSHRYNTAEARELARRVRGKPMPPPPSAVADGLNVVLAPAWGDLWEGPPWVLPISFGAVRDRTDALITLFLDHILRKRSGEPAHCRPEALFVLGLDPQSPDTWPHLFEPLEAVLVNTTPNRAVNALLELRRLAPTIRGTGQTVQARRIAPQEARAVLRMRQIAARLGHRGSFVRGLSIHQAKGQEWKYVGVRLSNDDLAALGRGLDIDSDRHRRLYVALTRGTDATGRVIGQCLP